MQIKDQFCTLFDCNYLLKGVVMLTTLRQWLPTAQVTVLCMDSKTQYVLESLNLQGVSTINLSDVEDEDLLRVKPSRSIAEYCWTLSASLCWYLMQHRPDIDRLTYLDADLMFFSPVQPIINEIGNNSITIIEHRFSKHLLHLEAYGLFNVEWVSFRRDIEGMACLKTWRDQCIEWCFARLEDGKLGDQKYLDEWPHKYKSLCILKHKGAGVAPWNYSNHKIFKNEDGIRVKNEPLIFYHFHQFQLLNGGKFNYVSDTYLTDVPLPEVVYDAYVKELQSALFRVRQIDPNFSSGIRPGAAVALRRIIQKFVPIWIKNYIRKKGLQVW